MDGWVAVVEEEVATPPRGGVDATSGEGGERRSGGVGRMVGSTGRRPSYRTTLV